MILVAARDRGRRTTFCGGWASKSRQEMRVREEDKRGGPMELDPRVVRELKEWHERLTTSGDLLTRPQLGSYYGLFRERFGPNVLRGLDGEQLLDLMHNHSNRDSLVYWLEFKGDEEFPARFGSIAGGSALKFGIYRRKETGNWMTGSSKKSAGDLNRGGDSDRPETPRAALWRR